MSFEMPSLESSQYVAEYSIPPVKAEYVPEHMPVVKAEPMHESVDLTDDADADPDTESDADSSATMSQDEESKSSKSRKDKKRRRSSDEGADDTEGAQGKRKAKKRSHKDGPSKKRTTSLCVQVTTFVKGSDRHDVRTLALDGCARDSKDEFLDELAKGLVKSNLCGDADAESVKARLEVRLGVKNKFRVSNEPLPDWKREEGKKSGLHSIKAVNVFECTSADSKEGQLFDTVGDVVNKHGSKAFVRVTYKCEESGKTSRASSGSSSSTKGMPAYMVVILENLAEIRAHLGMSPFGASAGAGVAIKE